ncbi:MAG TPA: hypothetical protein VGE18_02285 [Candidatus Paceibacterota bacterium]
MHNEHHQQQINGLLIIVSVLIVGGLLLFLMSGKRPVANAPVVPEPSANQVNDATVYANAEYGITLRYSADFVPQPALEGTYMVWDQEDPTPFNPLFEISLPKSFQPGTNFSEAWITLYASPGERDSCTLPQNGEVLAGTRNQWTVFTLGDAGAGNYYETTSYRMVKNDTCVMLNTVVHSVNVGHYPPELGIKEFDHIAVEQKLAEVIDTVTVQ